MHVTTINEKGGLVKREQVGAIWKGLERKWRRETNDFIIILKMKEKNKNENQRIK